VPTQEEDEDTHPFLTTDTISVIKARRGQGVFRRNLEEYWENKCSVTQAPDSSCGTILIASHIKPWVMSNNREKLDVNNGFLLLPNLDKTFDKGYISFADNGKILVSAKLSCSAELGIVEGMSINQEKLNDSHRKYLDFHRGNIFIGDE
jgi:predicted restriction endonuclease